MRFRTPRRDDAPFVMISIRVNHCDFEAVHQANRINSTLAVVEPVIGFFDRWSVEDPLGILEGDPMSDEVAAVLLFVPTIAPIMYLHNVNIKATVKCKSRFSLGDAG
jgi:hypothetical protein